jgi:cell division protease FtsH
MARKMVCEWGMSDRIGPLSYADGDNNPFLGGNGGITSRPYSESTAQEIDAEVKRIVIGQHDLALQLLRDNLDLLELMAQGLLEFEALGAKDIKMMLEEEGLEGIREAREAEKKKKAEKEEDRVPKTGYTTNIKDKKDKDKGAMGNLAPSPNS